MSYAPIVFISAKTGQRVDKLFETIHFVDVQNGTRVPTGALKDSLTDSVPVVRGTCFVTGVSEKEAIDEIIKILRG